ncbi:aldose 1-epimerase [Vibrio sp. 99-70-13A1]|uniref:aldose 1-epimerase n=1 Tax=Vibrio sp. 99-70-13A1 TaxID=2607601 RepID=UPI001493BB45|nr:aldose 1-epimerase [Vibrio sp. 99-70-13A1]NOH96054.1 aldose 1-epimerase [Vibrio sp. 99-70-13A1]
MFKIINENFGSLDAVTILNSQHGIELQIINGFGAIINKYIVNNSPFSFICGYKDSDDLIKQNPFFSRSAKLFPFPNRLNNGRFQFNDQTHQLPANFSWSEHAVHGLLYNQAFSVVDSSADESKASVTVQYSTQKLHDGFPFAFVLSVTFTIDIAGLLTCSTSVHNQGDATFPFGDAWHPYFSLDTQREHCTLTMPTCLELEHVNDLPSGQKHAFNAFSKGGSLANQILNNCFEFEGNTPINLTLERADAKACLHYQQDSSYPFIQLYTPTKEQSIAIEPMTCPADAFNNKIGLLTLEPQQTQTFSWQCQAQYHG